MWCVMERALTASPAPSRQTHDRSAQLRSLVRLLARQAAAEQIAGFTEHPISRG
jgi:hypothetical protein